MRCRKLGKAHCARCGALKIRRGFRHGSSPSLRANAPTLCAPNTAACALPQPWKIAPLLKRRLLATPRQASIWPPRSSACPTNSASPLRYSMAKT